MASKFRLLVLSCASVILFAPVAAVAQTISFGASVLHGQRYEHRISNMYTFVLSPNIDGWEIDVFTQGYPGDSLTVFTPPIHSYPFQEEITARNFIYSNGMMRPERHVIFSVKVLDLTKRFGGYLQPEDVPEISNDGTIDFQITDICLGNLTDSSRSYIKRMAFRATITYVAKPTLMLSRHH